MKNDSKIPIVIGVTGHRNICEQDVPVLRQRVEQAIAEVKALCNGSDTPIIMMCGMAQGADMLCAEAAFAMNVPVYAVLPFDKERFYSTFDDCPDRDRLYEYLDKCERVIYVPDIERNKDWLQSKADYLDDDSYMYRQVGVYMAERAHLMIALWDGKAPACSYGCGTVEVIDFALEHNYLNKDHLFKAAMVSDSAVVWIKTNRNRQDGEYCADTPDNEWLICDDLRTEQSGDAYYKRFKSSLSAPDFLIEAVNETAAYNNAEVRSDNDCHLWEDAEQLDDYRQKLRMHFIKADKLSYAVNQPKYKRFMLTLAMLGALIALTFMIYDDASLPWMIIPCTVAVSVIIALSFVCQKKNYHSNYIKYRALAEALRIQFYLTLSLDETAGFTNVCNLYSWSQKVNLVWIKKAIYAIEVVGGSNKIQRSGEFLNKVKEAWVGNCASPEGQLSYHTRKKVANRKQRDKLNTATQALTWTTVALYIVILILEVITFISEIYGQAFFWSGSSPIGLSYRSIGTIVVGALAATSLLLSSYWGKLSFDRLYDDNDKMSKLYRSAYSRWTEVAQSSVHSQKEFENFVTEIAREEIVENGIWCSYIEENTLDINL